LAALSDPACTIADGLQDHLFEVIGQDVGQALDAAPQRQLPLALRSVALRANDFVRQAKYHGLCRHMDTTSQALFKALQDSLKQEPVVAEDEARRMNSER